MTDLNKCLEKLKSPNPSERYEACEELRVATESSPEAILALEEAIRDEDPYVVERAIPALAADVHQQMGVKMGRYAPTPGVEPIPGEQPSKALSVTQGKKFGIRAGAYILDGVILNVVGIPIIPGALFLFRLAVGMLMQAHIMVVTGAPPWWVTYSVAIAVNVLYFVIFEWLYGATPAKLILKMRVVQADGQPCSFRAALVRGILRIFDGLFFGLVAYGNMQPPLQQRYGDKVARTMVVAASDPLVSRKQPAWRFFLAVGLVVLAHAGMYLALYGLSIQRTARMYSTGATDINLLASDLGSEFKLDGDYNLADFGENSDLDASRRTFSSSDMSLDSMVIYLASFPTDSDAAMQGALDKIARDILGDGELEARTSEIVATGDRGWAKVYHDQQSGYNLVIALVLEKNALVRVILYGDPSAATLENTKALAELIVERIRTGYRVPTAEGPAG
jgi:uncharacterized RDD family membrane protein YckC